MKSVFMLFGVLSIASVATAHNEHMLVGRTAGGQLTWAPGGVVDGATTILAQIPPGGPISGFSASAPGFSMLLTPVPADGVYTLAAGADVWVEIVRIDAPLLLVETPTYEIVNEKTPPEFRVGAGASAHAHPLWLLDDTAAEYDPSRCIWEATLILKDKGSTHYASSAPFVYRFVAGAMPSPADFDCDGDVDTADFAILSACATRSGVPYQPDALPSSCTAVPDHRGLIRPDLDRDGDVDLDDFGRFQRCYAGEGNPPGVNCDS